MKVEHSHSHDDELASRGRKNLLITLGLVVLVMVLEVVGGLISNSLSLLTDAAHMLVDALALGLAFFAAVISARPATSQKTYGYYRIEIIVALVNGFILGVTTIYIFFQAYDRLINPPEIEGPIMLVVAVVGLLSNIGGMFLLLGVSKANLNIKAAFWHVIGDSISSVGVIIAAIVITFSGWRYADGIMAVLIGIIILWGSIGLIREAIDVLLESVPRNIVVDDVIREIKTVPGVIDVHDMHIWSITSGINALSAHLMIEDQKVSDSESVVKQVNDKLSEKFKITHTTFQPECTCSSGYVCSMRHPG
jgi:cobalt-zinc-cadmium efflux system protein